MRSNMALGKGSAASPVRQAQLRAPAGQASTPWAAGMAATTRRAEAPNPSRNGVA